MFGSGSWLSINSIFLWTSSVSKCDTKMFYYCGFWPLFSSICKSNNFPETSLANSIFIGSNILYLTTFWNILTNSLPISTHSICFYCQIFRHNVSSASRSLSISKPGPKCSSTWRKKRKKTIEGKRSGCVQTQSICLKKMSTSYLFSVNDFVFFLETEICWSRLRTRSLRLGTAFATKSSVSQSILSTVVSLSSVKLCRVS